MKKTNLIKGILLILLSVVLIGTTGVYAASLDDEFLQDFSSNSTGSSNTSANNTANNVSANNSSANNVAANNSAANNKANNVSANNNATNNNSTNKTNTNSSVYNNTNSSNLPKTGVEDSIPTMVLVVVFAISAVYAFKKIKEYNV
ncbi:MAG: hypothetical protein IKF38_00820 [Clostridia bacterium]|nr:hypothetical protein [Clostridia bacterium]